LAKHDTTEHRPCSRMRCCRLNAVKFIANPYLQVPCREILIGGEFCDQVGSSLSVTRIIGDLSILVCLKISYQYLTTGLLECDASAGKSAFIRSLGARNRTIAGGRFGPGTVPFRSGRHVTLALSVLKMVREGT
jgi:hypothetical protein